MSESGTWKLWWHDRLGTFVIEQNRWWGTSYYRLCIKPGRWQRFWLRYSPPSGDYYEYLDEGIGWGL